jgi:7-cyano-7-deazaguanine synthase in queuosine biosynthesis
MFDYDQKHDKEILSAAKIAKSVKTEYSIVKINLSWSDDSLISKNKEIPVHKHLPKTVPLLTFREGTLFFSIMHRLAHNL